MCDSAATALKLMGRTSRQPDAVRALNFYGPEGSFPRISAWEVLDPERWTRHPRRAAVRDALVLVGPVVSQGEAGHPTPFGPQSGLGAGLHRFRLGVRHKFLQTGLGSLLIGGVIASVTEENGVLAGLRERHEFLAVPAADGTRVGFDGAVKLSVVALAAEEVVADADEVLIALSEAEESALLVRGRHLANNPAQLLEIRIGQSCGPE